MKIHSWPNVLRHPKKKTIVLFAEFHASPACPSERSIVKMKMTLEQLLNDADRVKPKYRETNLSQWCTVSHISPVEGPDVEPRYPRGEVGKYLQ